MKFRNVKLHLLYITLLFGNMLNSQPTNPVFLDDNVPVERVWVNVTTPSGFYNETLIAFKEDATLGYDSLYDAFKIPSSNVSFYSRIGSANYVIQALPMLNQDITIQLGIEASNSGEQTLSIGETTNFSDASQLILEDTKLNVFHNLRAAGSYQYTFNRNSDVLRFKLHAHPPTQFLAWSETCKLLNDGSILAFNPSEIPCVLNISDNIGGPSKSYPAFTDSFTIDSLPPAFYTISLSSVFGSISSQVISVEEGIEATLQISADNGLVSITNPTVAFEASASVHDSLVWDFGDGSIRIGTTSETYTYSYPGIFQVICSLFKDQCQLQDALSIGVQDFTTNITQLQSRSEPLAIPNPASEFITLTNLQGDYPVEFMLTDQTGRVCLKQTYIQQEQIDLRNLRRGTYLVRSHSISNQTTRFSKLVVN
jgi:hypothetical protein